MVVLPVCFGPAITTFSAIISATFLRSVRGIFASTVTSVAGQRLSHTKEMSSGEYRVRIFNEALHASLVEAASVHESECVKNGRSSSSVRALAPQLRALKKNRTDERHVVSSNGVLQCSSRSRQRIEVRGSTRRVLGRIWRYGSCVTPVLASNLPFISTILGGTCTGRGQTAESNAQARPHSLRGRSQTSCGGSRAPGRDTASAEVPAPGTRY